MAGRLTIPEVKNASFRVGQRANPTAIWRVGGQMGHRDTKYIRLPAFVAKGERAELPDLQCCKAPASSTKRLHVPLPLFVLRNPFGRGTLFRFVSNGSNLLARFL
jgi:hypothetical protein